MNPKSMCLVISIVTLSALASPTVTHSQESDRYHDFAVAALSAARCGMIIDSSSTSVFGALQIVDEKSAQVAFYEVGRAIAHLSNSVPRSFFEGTNEQDRVLAQMIACKVAQQGADRIGLKYTIR
jgi:hypothetical protein